MPPPSRGMSSVSKRSAISIMAGTDDHLEVNSNNTVLPEHHRDNANSRMSRQHKSKRLAISASQVTLVKMKANRRKADSMTGGFGKKYSMDSDRSNELLQEVLQDLIVDAGKRRGWCHGEPITESGKRRQIAKVMSLLLVPVLCLLIISSYFVVETFMINSQNEKTRGIIKFSIELGEVLQMLQLERDQSVLYLSNIGPQTKTFLNKQYLETNDYIDRLSMWPGELENNANEYVRSRKSFQRHLTSHRNKLDLLNYTVFQEIDFYNELITIFHKWLYRTLDESRYSTMWKTLVAYQKVIFARLYVGVERALGSFFYSKGGFHNHSTYESFNNALNVFRHSFKTAQNFSKLVKPISSYDVALISGQNLTSIIDRYRSQIQYLNLSEPSLREARYYFDNMTSFIDILYSIQIELASDILHLVNGKKASTVGTLAISVGLVLIVVGMVPMLTQAIHRTTSDLQSYAILLADQTKDLHQEKAKTDTLLFEMLPRQVAQQLKEGVAVKAEYYREVTVCFTDIVGFAVLMHNCKPMELVSLMNELFRLFDSRIDLFDVYKVETVRDSYMIASGLPIRIGNRHASEIAKMSLDLMDTVSDIYIQYLPAGKLQLRIGVHSGPVVAGVVGRKLPRYCLFGDTVNTASRMETNGVANRVHISADAYQLLKAHGGFKMSCRGNMEVKGKGMFTSYWLDDLELESPSADDRRNVAIRKDGYKFIKFGKPADLVDSAGDDVNEFVGIREENDKNAPKKANVEMSLV